LAHGLTDFNVLLGRLCNAECAHCSILSSPHNKRRMSESLLSRVEDHIRAFARRVPHGRVVFTGGEPLLYRAPLGRLGTLAHGLGLATVVETNGVWAKSADIAQRTLAKLPLTAVILSASEFHGQFVPRERVRIAYEAARANALSAQIRVSRGPDPTSWEDLVEWARSFVAREDLIVEDALPFGRFETHAADPGTAAADDDPLRCPSDGPIVLDDGRIDPCCGTLNALPAHALVLGTADDEPDALLDRLDGDPMLAFIRTHGLRRLIAHLQARGAAIDATALAGDVCTVCARLATNPDLQPWLAQLRRDGLPRA
jgi:hypothetical protein